MSIISRILGRSPKPQQFRNNEERPTPKALAAYVFNGISTTHEGVFGVRPEDFEMIAQKLPFEVQSFFKNWSPFYVGWRFVERSGELYGIGFRSDTIALIPTLLDPVRGKFEHIDEQKRYFETIFRMMDNVRNDGEVVSHQGFDLPIVLRIVLGFAVLSESNEGQERCVELGLAFEELHERCALTYDHGLRNVATHLNDTFR